MKKLLSTELPFGTLYQLKNNVAWRKEADWGERFLFQIITSLIVWETWKLKVVFVFGISGQIWILWIQSIIVASGIKRNLWAERWRTFYLTVNHMGESCTNSPKEIIWIKAKTKKIYWIKDVVRKCAIRNFEIWCLYSWKYDYFKDLMIEEYSW